MDTTEHHASEDSAPETRDEPGVEAYEPPSFTELGSFLELTAGAGAAPGDTGNISGKV